MQIRTLKSRLSKAGFVCCSRRGKGSHSVWKHPIHPISIVQSGKDNSDANAELANIEMVHYNVETSSSK